MSQIRTFANAVAIVTGAGSGIGAAIAAELTGRGASVVVADRHAESAGETVRAIEERGGRAAAIEVDVRDAGRVAEMVAGTFERYGRLDYLFNNAGIAIGAEVLNTTLDDWRCTVEVNLMGVVHGVQSAYPRMAEQGFGHIVNTAAIAGLMPLPFAASYSATKHAVVGLTRALRAEAASYGVRASVFCPGAIRTPILTGGRYGELKADVPKAYQAAMWEKLRPMDPRRFAAAALDQVANNREIIIVPGWWRAVWWLNRLSPRLSSALTARGFRDMKEQIETQKAGSAVVTTDGR